MKNFRATHAIPASSFPRRGTLGNARRTVTLLGRFLGVSSFARCDIRERAREDAHARTTRGSRMNDHGLEIKEIGMQKDSPTSPSSSRVVSQRVARARLPELGLETFKGLVDE